MTYYAHVTDGTVDQARGSLPAQGVRQDNGNVVLAFPSADTATQQACGWYPVTNVAKPTPAQGDTIDRSLVFANGNVTETWTERAMTADELAAQTTSANRTALLTQAANAMAQLQTYIDASPVNVTSVATAQTVCRGLQTAVQYEAQVLRKLIRLAVNELDGTS